MNQKKRRAKVLMGQLAGCHIILNWILIEVFYYLSHMMHMQKPFLVTTQLKLSNT